MRIVGSWKFQLERKGKIVLARKGKNLVVNAGLTLVAQVLASNGQNPPVATQFAHWLSLGTDGSAVDPSQIGLLGTEVISPRIPLAVGNNGPVFQCTQVYLNAGASVTIREMGLFSTSAIGTGTMLARMVVQDFVYANGDNLLFTWSEEVQ